MPFIEIDPRERRKVEEFVRFVGEYSRDLTPQGRQVLVIELTRYFKTEIDALKQKTTEAANGG